MVDHPCGVASLECQNTGQESLRSKGEREELVGAGQQQEATVSKADPSFSSRESGVRAIMK